MKVVFHRNFDGSFSRIQPKIKKQFMERLNVFVGDPFAKKLNNHALKGKYAGYRSINVTGDWRAIYFQQSKEVVEFVEIDTHSNLYS